MVVAFACAGFAFAGFAFAGAPWVLGVFALVLGTGFGALMLGRLNYVARQCPVAYPDFANSSWILSIFIFFRDPSD